ncbi:hypothetical protein PV327_010290 [Microctonus hyperodae]|uniref:Uncharacterized protein n=1 Tax=Microctonus hyperodae TaxID=165561 RepID=A0AA39FS70_MICHY|nr:hypothetical protein PV327_010290 [Microctonus hyperodae]
MLACSACKKRPTGSVYLCGSGHSICGNCTLEKTICTECNLPYTKIPNLLAQNLLSKYNDFQVYLKELYNFKEKYEQLLTLTNKKNYDNKLSNGNHVKYSCWMSDDCKFSGNISTIVEHFKDQHNDQFEEHSDGDFPYMKSYEMDYELGKNFDDAIKIGKEIFIIHISINDKGEFGACVIMYNQKENVSKYCCQVDIECGPTKQYFMNAQVITARAYGHTIRELKHGGLCISYNKNLYNRFRENSHFSCIVTVQEKNRNFPVKKNAVGKIKDTERKTTAKTLNINNVTILNNPKCEKKNDLIILNREIDINEHQQLKSDINSIESNISGKNSSIVAPESNIEDRDCILA